MDELELMRLRVETDFVRDGRGRLLLTNEPRAADRRAAPRCWLGWTAAGYLVRFGATVPAALVEAIEAMVARAAPAGAVAAPPELLTGIGAVLARQAPVVVAGGGPAYRFPETIVRSGEAVPLNPANREVARATLPWLFEEIEDWQPCCAVVRGGAAVSVCFSSRLSAGAAEAGVETRPEWRGRGYASLVVAGWGAAVLASGRVPLYSTAWANLASRGVARRLGLVRFGADAWWA